MMTDLRKTMDGRYKDGWQNVQSDCTLCHMTKRTEWHIETPNFIIADTLSGSPFIVSKTHEQSLSEARREKAEHLVSLLYDEFELVVRMNMVKNHWHAHVVIEGEQTELRGE